MTPKKKILQIKNIPDNTELNATEYDTIPEFASNKIESTENPVTKTLTNEN